MELKFSYPKFIMPALFNEDYISVIRAGRRSGKTYNAVQWLIEELLPHHPVAYPLSGIWIDTKHTNIDKYVDRYFKPILDPVWHLCNWNQQKKILTLPNQAYIDFGSAEKPENLEGFGYGRFVINEGGIVLKKQTLWDNTLEPMFQHPNCKGKIIGTPKGKGKFMQLAKRYNEYHFPAHISPYWDEKRLKDLEKKVPVEVWRQEYLAEYIEGAGEVFRNINNCIKGEVYDQAQNGQEYVMGVDLAKHQDFTVIMVAERDTKQIVYMDRFNAVDWMLQKKRIVSTWQRFNHAKLIIDSTGVGDAIYDDLVNAGVQVEGFKFSSKTKNELIQNLSVAIDNQDIYFPDIPTLIDELSIYSYDVTPSGNFRYNAPEGYHDDTVIALALVNKLLQGETEYDLSFI